MYLVELLRHCKDSFIARERAGLLRDGIAKEEAEAVALKLGELLDFYNDELLRYFGENIVLKTKDGKGQYEA